MGSRHEKLSPDDRLYGVQMLRGIAAVLVLLHHEMQVAGGRIPNAPYLRFVDNGAFGVDLFFPISGLVIYLAASKLVRQGLPQGGWRAFAWRRFIRIAPLYWLFTTLKLALAILIPGALLHYRFDVFNTIASFLFLPVYNAAHVPLPVLPVGWTLAYEMLFYVIITAALFLRVPILVWSSGIIVALSLIGLVFPPGLGGLSYLADPIELEFLGGMLIIAASIRGWRLPRSVAFFLLPASLAFALIAPPSPSALEFTSLRPLVWGVPGVLIVWAVVEMERDARQIANRTALLIGDASYSLYLTHTFITPALGLMAYKLHLAGASGLVLFMAVDTIACVAFAVGFHLRVELPLLATLNRTRRKRLVTAGSEA